MARPAPLRIAVAGAGRAARAYIACLDRHDDCLLVGVAGPAAAAAEVTCAAGVPRFEELATLLDTLRPDGAILATPGTLHLEGALQCLERSVPVLVEPPVADTLDDALRLADAEVASRVPVLVGQVKIAARTGRHPDPLARQLAHFCAVIRGQAEPRINAADAARTLRSALVRID